MESEVSHKESLKYAYYPGCSLHATAVDYNESTLAVAEALGIKMEEVPDWSCCGSTMPGLWIAASADYRESGSNCSGARNLAVRTKNANSRKITSIIAVMRRPPRVLLRFFLRKKSATL